jgi:hypothetical protein
VPPQTPLVQTSFLVQSWPSLQPVPFILLPPSTHVCTPVEQSVVPFLQALLGFVVHAAPVVQATQFPPLLQTILVPQGVPAAFCVLLLQVIAPVEQLVMPV